MVAFDKDKAYMEVLYEFRRLLDTEFKEGGWLSPAREMSKRFGVSVGTYGKALSCLVMEGMAESFPRQGVHVVPQKYRPKKIGLAMGDGRESPYFPEETIVVAILQKLYSRGYGCHLIQGSPVSNVPRTAMSHCTSGLIWLRPFNTAFPVLKDIRDNQLFPLITIFPYYPSAVNDLPPAGVPSVSEDYAAMGDKLAALLVERGHGCVACVGWNKWFVDYIGFASKLRKAGIAFGGDHVVENYFHNPGELTRLIVEKGVTGVIAEVGARYIEAMFDELLALPEEFRPDVIVRNRFRDVVSAKAYPPGKIIAWVDDLPGKFGEAAVDMLLDKLDCPEDVSSVKVKTYHVFSGNGSTQVN